MVKEGHKALRLEKKKKVQLRLIYLLASFVALVIVASMGYIFYAGNRMASVHGPLIDAAMEIKLEATTAHLWFEEIISGDTTHDFNDILKDINDADWYANAMLEGGENPEGKFYPLEDFKAIQGIREVRRKLAAFKDITLRRWENKDQAGIGSAMEQEYDAIFSDFLEQADIVETDLQAMIERELKHFKAVQAALIITCGVITVLVGGVIGQFMRRQIRDQMLLEATNHQLDAANQQLRASEQELRASNEQLVASEQQLRAANQQLVSSEQQLRAANQQLIAHEQQLRAANDQLTTSEERYRSLVETIPGVVWTSDENGSTTFISPAVERIYGYTPGEIYEKGDELWFGRIHPDDVERVKKAFEAVFKESVPLDVEYRIRRKDGEWIWLNDRSYGAYEKNGVKYAAGVFFDITERKHAENALRKSEEKYRSFYEDAPVGYQSLDAAGCFLDVNAAWLETLGYEKDEVIGRCFSEFVAPESLEVFTNNFPRFKAGGKTRSTEFEMIRKDKSRRLVSFDGNIEYDRDGNFKRTHCIMNDITDRKRAEQALRQERDKAQKYLDISAVMFVVVDADQKVSMINKQGCDILGYRQEDVLGKNWFDCFLPERLREDVIPVFKQLMAGEIEPVEYFENPVLTRNGEEKLIAWHNTMLKNENGEIIGTLSSGEDITERKEAEERLLRYQQRLKTLASELSLAEERERREVATLLHDNVAQNLILFKLKLGSLREAAVSAQLTEPLDEIYSQMDRIIHDMRSLTFDLSCPILHELGLAAALREWLGEQIEQKHGIKTEFSDDGKNGPLDSDVLSLLYRSVQELLINVVKHAQAKHIKVAVSCDKDNVSVNVVDDGVGFEPPAEGFGPSRTGGFGLFSICERLEHFRGNVEIKSEPGRGTDVLLTVPIKSEKKLIS